MMAQDDEDDVLVVEQDDHRRLEENSHLLQDAEYSAPFSGGQSAISSASKFSPISKITLYCMALHFLLAFFEMVLSAPLLSLFEQSLCVSYYATHDPSIIGHSGSVPEALCKLPEIQRDLATVRGWKSLFDTIPGQSTRSG